MPASDFLVSSVRAHLLRSGTWTKPTGLWVALYVTAPSRSGGGVEVSGGGYARVRHGPGDAYWSASIGGLHQNVAAIRFGAPTTPWGMAVAFGLLGASAAGEFYGYGLLPTPLDIVPGGGAPYFAPGALRVRLLATG